MQFSSFFGKTSDSEFSIGQVWAYLTRTGEELSTILINKIEQHEKLGQIFHISINDIQLKNVWIPNGIQSVMPHLPVSEKTMKMSVAKLVAINAINEDYLEGYYDWKLAFDGGKAGIYTISIVDILGVIEQATNSAQKE